MSFSLAESELGRTLDRAQLHSVPTLNDVTPTMLEELRRLSGLAIHAYLKWHILPNPLNDAYFTEFTRDVIHGDTEPRTWGHRDVLALIEEVRRGQALTMNADQLRAMLADVDGERWMRISVGDARRVNRDSGSSGWGAPGVLVRHAPYWWVPPKKEVMDYIVSSREMDAISDVDFVVAFRRWIARRVAWWTKSRDIELATASPKQVAELIGVNMGSVSADGAIALSALIREAKLPFDPDKHVRGYVGPDEWYAG